MINKFNFVFFGSSPISVTALDILEKHGMMPSAVVTQIDKPQGRGLELVATPVKIWAERRRIPVEFWDSDLNTFLGRLESYKADVFVLVSFGKMLPDEILNMAPKGIVNLHPSLLPLLRGPSPIETTILRDMKDDAGVSVMLLTKGMDEGPILAQKKVEALSPKGEWPPRKSELYQTLSHEGAELLAETLPLWAANKIEPVEQNHANATYSKIIDKKDGEIDLSADAYQNYLKIRAFEEWPGTYFFKEHAGKSMRIKIKDAAFDNGVLTLLRVVPEGKKEMSYDDFLRGFN